MLFYDGKKHIYKSSLRQCTKNVSQRILAKWPRRKNEFKNEKSQFLIDQNHFEASQCPQVLGSNTNGEKAAGAQAISERDPEGRPVRGRIENAQESKNHQTSDKNGFGNYEIL